MGKIRTSKRTHSKRKSLKRNNFHLKGGSAGAKGIDYETLFKKTLEFYDNEFKSVTIESYSFKADNIGFKNGEKFRYYEGEEKCFKQDYIKNDDDFDTYINTIQEKINKWNECLNVETEVPDVEVTTQKTKPEKLFIYSDSHGIYNEKYGTVPDNIVVCLLTRIGQYGFALNNIDAMKPILSIIDFNESEFETLFANKIKNTTEVFDNKINKWKQRNFNNCFQYSSWYYPGQTFDDLDLIYDGSAESLGIYFFKTDKKDKKNVARKGIKNKNEYHEGEHFAYYKTKFGTETTLANLLTTLQKNFPNKKILITIECCRKMEKIESDQIKIHADFYTQIINNYFINNQNIEPGEGEPGSLHFPVMPLEHSDIFKKTVPVTGDNLNNVDKLLKANVKGLPEVKQLDYEEIKDPDIEKLKKEIKIYTSLKNLINHLNNLIGCNNYFDILIKKLSNYTGQNDYSTINKIKALIDSQLPPAQKEAPTSHDKDALVIYNMFIKDTFKSKDAKIKIAREGIITLIDSTFRKELLIINPDLIAILDKDNLNITLKTYGDIPPGPTTTTNPTTKVSVLKNNLNMFTEAIKRYMEVLNENYEKKYIEVRKTLRDIVLTTTGAAFYIKYDLPIRRIPFDGENKLLKKLGATITKLEIIDVFFYNGIPLRYTESPEKTDIEMDISKIFNVPNDEGKVTYKITDLNVYKPGDKNALLTKIKNSDIPGGFFIKVKRAPAGAPAEVPPELQNAYDHFIDKDEIDIKIAQNKLLMNIKKDIQKEIDNIKIKESVDNDYKATKDIFDNLKLIYKALGHSTSSLNEYERDLEILNPGVGYKTIYTNQDVALKQLKKLLELKIKNIMEEISGQSYNDRGVAVQNDNEGAVPNDIKDENILKQDYDLSLEPVKKDYIHETEFHNQDFICESASSLTYIYKKKDDIIKSASYLTEYNPLANVFIIKFFNFIKKVNLLYNPEEIINFVSNLKTSSIGQFSIFVHYMKRHHDNFRNDLFPEVKGTDDKSVYTNLFNIYVDLIFNSIFVKKIERTINAKFEDTVRDEKKENEEIYSEIILEHSVKLKFIKIYLDEYPIEQAKVRDIYELAGAGSAEAGDGASIIEKIYTFLSDNNYIYTYIFKQLIDNTKSLLENSFIEGNMSLIKSIDDINQNNIITTKVLQLVKTFNKIFYKLDSYYSPLNKITEFIISKLDDCKKYETLSQQSSFNTKFVNTLNIQIPYNKYELTELKKLLENKSIKTLKIYSYEWENFEEINLFEHIANLFYNWSLHNQKILDGTLYPNLINLNYSPNIYKYEQLDFSKLKKLSTLTINLSLFNNSSVDITYKPEPVPEPEPEPGHILQELTINNIYIKELSVTCKNLILNNCNSDINISHCNITKLTILNCAIEKKLKDGGKTNLDGAIEIYGGKTIIHDFLGTIESLKLDNCFIEDEFESLDFTNLKNLELINVTNYKNRLVNPHILDLTKIDFKKLGSLTIHGSNITCDLSSLFGIFFDTRYNPLHTRYNPKPESDNFLTVNLEITDLYDLDGILSKIRTKVGERWKEKEQAKAGYVEPPYQNIIFNIMGKSPKADILYKHFNSDGLKIICNKEDGIRESVV